MKERKSDKGNLENKRALFVLIGLAIALIMVYASFELFATEDNSSTLATNEDDFVQVKDEDVMSTDKSKVTPQKTAPQQATLIHEVDNATKITRDFTFSVDIFPDDPVSTFDTKPIEIIDLPSDPEPPRQFSEIMPQFPGGMDALTSYLAKEIHYPELARNNNIQGTVIVKFVVEKDGSVSNASVLVPLFPDCDKEAIRGILSMPKWQPGTTMGKAVRCYYQVPVKFQL